MIRRFLLLFSLFIIFFIGIPSFVFSAQGTTPKDPYKVLGVDRSASQREIQKAFHKLSLQYHPDKNKSKGAQDKFSEINNAYDILSDEEKRKNYDLYGHDEGGRGSDGGNFGGGNFGGNEGYTFFTGGGSGDSRSTFRPEGWQATGGHGNAESFFFSFGGDSGQSGSSFGSSASNIFSSFFGGHSKDGSHSSSFKSSAGTKTRSSTGSIQDINLRTFKKEINDQGVTWLLLFYIPTTMRYHEFESITEDVANSLQGAIKAGKINCQNEQALCKELGVWPSKSPRLFSYSYSYKTSKGDSLAEYTGLLDARKLKTFCQDQLPRFSKCISPDWFESSSKQCRKLSSSAASLNKKRYSGDLACSQWLIPQEIQIF